MSYNSQSQSINSYQPQYFSHLTITRRIKLKLKYIRPEYLFEQYYLFLIKPEDLGETKYIKKNNRKESIETLYKNLEKRINSTIEYQKPTYSPYYQAQPEKKKQEQLQSSYIKFLEELYEKQTEIWIANQYTIVETYEELEKYHEQYWERESISILEQINPNKDFYLKLNGPGGKAIHEKDENIDKEARYIVTLAIYLHPLEEPPKHTEPCTLGPWYLYKIKDLLKHRNELVPILEENIELIDGKIKAYEQDVLDLPINVQKLEEIKTKMEKQLQQTQETFNFLNDIELEIPEEEIPEIVDEQFPVLALNFGKLSSYEIHP
ncbi:hypothetical protein C2G38_2184093 [Gigaspora rosea]|uniref:Uncharacterized protein n=1 Tax=Gigaspora rosea TaxID=44941 RepID=A0A397VCF5_9GLOM|nr:hypothetical protein C2G38_2184093 [Gigaspora rosea]